ncbi:unnamed protein product [Candida verbasci]|uniref:CBS domain-containing protein n=1 Tax=Candida verbasci TaxID=1227364 RepID=A0A9W4TWX8_9ASCO|nr:unnamed protein product [Candida verbasci]
MTDNPILFHRKDYRGATIEDLNLPPAISINPSSSIYEAFKIGFEYEFSYLPVINEINKKLLGVINIDSLKHSKIEHAKHENVLVKDYMIWFNQKSKINYEKNFNKQIQKTLPNTKIVKPTNGKRYQLLTPYTPLETLANFFNSGEYFAVITGDDGNFVYGVVTPEDLIKYEKSRPFKL